MEEQVAATQKLREQVVRWLHQWEAAGHESRAPVDEISAGVNASKHDVVLALHFLKAEGLVSLRGEAYARLTHEGKREGEQLATQKTDPYAERKARRYQVLQHLYDQSGASTKPCYEVKGLGDELGYSLDEMRDIIKYLEGEGLVRIWGTAGVGVTLEHAGIKAVEAALEDPGKPTKYYPGPSVHHHIHIGSASQTVIQQGSHSSSQSVTFNAPDYAALAKFLEALRPNLEQLAVSPEELEDIRADIASLEAQVKKQEPRQSIVSECLGSVRGFLQKAADKLQDSAAAATAAEFLHQLNGLAARLPPL